MPIRTKPFTEITLADVQDLIAREIREDATLEFKRQLDLENRDQRYELLKDISGMANAAGGTIIYGAAEGSEGPQRGQIVAVHGQALEPDPTELTIQNLLRDSLDERLTGVLFKALPTETPGEYVCVVRIPSSPLGPHRITLGEKPQFYLRGSVSNIPMNTHQIRQMIVQRETAMERAVAEIEKRTEALKNAAVNRQDFRFDRPAVVDPDQVVLHIIPLFPHTGGWRLGPARERRLMQVPALGRDEPLNHARYSSVGMYQRYPGRRHVLFLRSGGLEFQRYEVLNRRGGEAGVHLFEAYEVELDVLGALKAAAALTDDGLLPLPALVSLRILDVRNTKLQRYPRDVFGAELVQDDADDVLVTPFVVDSWATSRQQVRDAFDEMWQGWHLPQSYAWYDDGEHHQYDRDGLLIQRPEVETEGRS